MFLQENTDFAVLWWNTTKSSKKKESGFGMGDSLNSLAKAGYGDIKTLKKLTLIELLELMVKELRDAVQSLSGMDKTSIEIVEATKLPLEQVNFLLK